MMVGVEKSLTCICELETQKAGGEIQCGVG